MANEEESGWNAAYLLPSPSFTDLVSPSSGRKQQGERDLRSSPSRWIYNASGQGSPTSTMDVFSHNTGMFPALVELNVKCNITLATSYSCTKYKATLIFGDLRLMSVLTQAGDPSYGNPGLLSPA